MFHLPIAPDTLPEPRGLKSFLLIQRYCFACIGIDPTSLENTVYNRWLAWIPMLCMMTLLGPMALYALEYMNVDLDQMANAISPMWQASLSVVKFFLFMWNKRKIVRLVRKVWLWTLEADIQELAILEEENRYDASISLFYYSSVCSTATLALVAPFLVAYFYAWKGYGFWESLEEPFKANYIVDPKKSVWAFVFCFIWVLLGIYYVVHGTLAIDSLFSWFMRNICAQFRILNSRFKAVADNASVRKTEGNYTDNDLVKDIVACVQYHRRIIDLAFDFNEVYKHIVFVKFLLGCAQLAGLTFQLANGGDLIIRLFNVSFLISVSTQLMLYCYGGQKIKDMSSSVNTAIYEYFRWQDLHVETKKILLLPIMRSQKPCHLTGIFFVADLSLFVWVFKTAASFMTMMLSVDKKKL